MYLQEKASIVRISFSKIDWPNGNCFFLIAVIQYCSKTSTASPSECWFWIAVGIAIAKRSMTYFYSTMNIDFSFFVMEPIETCQGEIRSSRFSIFKNRQSLRIKFKWRTTKVFNKHKGHGIICIWSKNK